MSIVLLARTDGRDELLFRTLESAQQNLIGPITRRVVHTDAGAEHVEFLRTMLPTWEVIGGSRLGFGGALNRAWRHVAAGDEDWVFDLEDDFVFMRPVDLAAIIDVMTAHPHVVQMALRRQPVAAVERSAGGVVEQWPEAYAEIHWKEWRWLEHRLFLTTNPALWRMERCGYGWPTVDASEALYSSQTFQNPKLRAGYWGPLSSGEAVHHIGTERRGRGY